MPYIKFDERIKFFKEIINISKQISSPGELNYCVTRLILDYLFIGGKQPKYEDYNAAVGVLECAKQELYRIQIASYEDIKIKENGEV